MARKFPGKDLVEAFNRYENIEQLREEERRLREEIDRMSKEFATLNATVALRKDESQTFCNQNQEMTERIAALQDQINRAEENQRGLYAENQCLQAENDESSAVVPSFGRPNRN
jgi:chromosome segregation ATPase